MRSQGLRLTTWLMLAAFLTANSIALASPRLAVTHCDCAEDAEHHNKIQTDSSPSCPDHHDCPKPCCPCPGGCAYCNVAKVPSTVASALTLEPAACVGHCLLEAPLCYLAPFHGTLIRPPRV